MNGRYTKDSISQRIGTPLDIREWIRHLLAKSVRDAKLNRLITLLCPAKAYEGCALPGPCQWRSWEESAGVQQGTSERSLLSDDSKNAIRLAKYADRVTGSRHARKTPITHSLMQA